MKELQVLGCPDADDTTDANLLKGLIDLALREEAATADLQEFGRQLKASMSSKEEKQQGPAATSDPGSVGRFGTLKSKLKRQKTKQADAFAGNTDKYKQEVADCKQALLFIADQLDTATARSRTSVGRRHKEQQPQD